MEEGVLITDLAGLHSGANTVSGDFSLAAGGYHIKDGKIASTLKLMTIAGNYFDYLIVSKQWIRLNSRRRIRFAFTCCERTFNYG